MNESGQMRAGEREQRRGATAAAATVPPPLFFFKFKFDLVRMSGSRFILSPPSYYFTYCSVIVIIIFIINIPWVFVIP